MSSSLNKGAVVIPIEGGSIVLDFIAPGGKLSTSWSGPRIRIRTSRSTIGTFTTEDIHESPLETLANIFLKILEVQAGAEKPEAKLLPNEFSPMTKDDLSTMLEQRRILRGYTDSKQNPHVPINATWSIATQWGVVGREPVLPNASMHYTAGVSTGDEFLVVDEPGYLPYVSAPQVIEDEEEE